MRIAYVYDAVYPYIMGGVERRVWEVSRRLAGRGHDVHVYGMQWWAGDPDIEREGVHLHGTCRPLPLYRKGRRTFFPAVLFAASLVVPLARKQFDIIDCQHFPYLSALTTLAAGRLAGSRVVVTWHEVWGDYWYDYLGLAGALGKAVERVLATGSTFPVAVSDATREGMGKAGVRGVVPVIPNGIDLAWIRSIGPSPVASDVIFVGRLIREKHVDLLIEAVRLLRRDLPDIRCLVVGDGPERQLLEAMAAELGVSGSITFTGFLEKPDDVIACMKSSRVFVLPSTREGFGISVLEALACGLPVVTIDDPANASRMFARDGCGLLSSPDAGDLAGQVRTILSGSGYDPAACRAKAQAYDWGAVTDRVEEYYRGIWGR
ncbi:glycosyltransferase [hydrocarbon metagenome]|uniref:Glycosyltransferase n=1 Tax=hydrocarbon metagenome TaxID=938273 RepID=A0A0W8F1X3_9ZZZZ